jgi:hypothetical protein
VIILVSRDLLSRWPDQRNRSGDDLELLVLCFDSLHLSSLFLSLAIIPVGKDW